MKTDLTAAMRSAAARTRAQDPMGATRIIREALAGRPLHPAPEAPPRSPRSRPGRIDPNAETVEPLDDSGHGDHGGAPRMRLPLREVVRRLREGRAHVGLGGRMPAAPPPVPEGARFEVRRHSGPEGARDYKLYVPSGAPQAIRGLVVMLHGCKQDPDDFAAGTGMNALAETEGLLVAYPRQGARENAGACWNWFEPGHQGRAAGEPAILAGLTRALVAEFHLAPGRAFVAGLSAGGAMAAVLGATHPDVFAAVGIHSGLPHGAASDVISAFAAMRGEALGPAVRPRPQAGAAPPRVIVFHGSADRTVHPANADRIVAAATAASGGATRTETGRAEGGETYTRTVLSDARGTPAVEAWRIDGAGHAWSGGDASGSYTDPRGPDASAAMLRFFLAGG